MKILIGTPIHEVKDYAIPRWLENVAKLQQKYPADLLLVDNSDNVEYVEKVKGYCKKYKVKNYDIKHLKIGKWQPSPEKIGRSREIIREVFLAKEYDAWFSWECDQIIPTNTLNVLIKIMSSGNYSMVHPNSLSREMPTDEPNANFGCCLIHRKALEKHSFMLTPPDDCWASGEARFKKQVLAAGGTYIEIYGIIKPIYHLDK